VVVRRRTAHLAFGATALALALIAGYEGLRLREGMHVNAVIAGESAVDSGSDLPEARFMRAQALAKRGDYQGALAAYKVLARDAHDSLAIASLYNAGNLQLREALKEGPNAAFRALPLIELSKQSYRAVLRRDPQNWDARYNLERALWLAPEIEEGDILRVRRDVEERVMSTLQSTRADLP
jgi:mxaK protein